jgi:hypothetical protein
VPNSLAMSGIHPESPHAAATFSSEEDEIASRKTRLTQEEREAATSSRLIDLINIFFALVLGDSVARYSGVVSAPWHSNVPVLLALLTIYYTILRSYVAWHAAIVERRYRIYASVRTTELWRVYIDVTIVAVYAYMFIVSKPLEEHPGADVSGLFYAFPVMFLLYALWGQLRRAAWGPDDFKLRILFGFALLYALVALQYRFSIIDVNVSNTTGNVIGLVTALGLMASYRYVNFWQGAGDAVDRWHGIPHPRWPNLRTLRGEA